ncbi:MAG: MarR family transcriptional regulator [Rhizobacter sp.]|nr:MarR family transcriptional regulator [Rhizobacter sp.]
MPSQHIKVEAMKQENAAPKRRASAKKANPGTEGAVTPTPVLVISHVPEHDLVGRGIKQWRTERPDLDSSGKAVVGRLLRLEEVVLRAINSVLQPFGLKYQEYAVLATLRVAGAPYRLSPSRLQATLLFTSGGLSNLLKRLEREGWVRRSSDPKDGRGVLVKLTPKGLRLADEAMPKHAAAEQHLLRMFDSQQRENLSALLSMMMVGNAPELGPEPS